MAKQLLSPEEKRLIRGKCIFTSLKATYKLLLKTKKDYPTRKTILHFMEREYYTAVFDSPAIQTGLHTYEYTATKDHYMSPQILSNFIFDQADIYLKDFDKFYKIFELSCRTIATTLEINMIIRGQKKRFGLTSEESYKKSNIDLYIKYDLVKDHSKYLAIPKEITEWEREFKSKNFELHKNENFKVPLSYQVGTLEKFL